MSRSRSKRRRRKSPVSPRPSDVRLYKRIVKEAQRRFQVWPSAYASGWVVAEYKRRGGTYISSHRQRSPSLKRWFNEEWIDVCYWPRRVPCGRSPSASRSRYPYCRPLRRVTSRTPRTVQELSPSELKRRCRRKRSAPYRRLVPSSRH